MSESGTRINLYIHYKEYEPQTRNPEKDAGEIPQGQSTRFPQRTLMGGIWALLWHPRPPRLFHQCT